MKRKQRRYNTDSGKSEPIYIFSHPGYKAYLFVGYLSATQLKG